MLGLRRIGRRWHAPLALAVMSVLIAVGATTAYASTTGVYYDGNANVGAGPTPFNSTFTGSGNAALGDSMMGSLTSGSSNVAAGHDALTNDTSGYDNLAL